MNLPEYHTANPLILWRGGFLATDTYPTGRVKRGGISDKLLGDYPNLFEDLSANSGNNALSRDPEFTRDFLKRHESKLIFGSDCACADGKGGGVSQANNPAAAGSLGNAWRARLSRCFEIRSRPQLSEK